MPKFEFSEILDISVDQDLCFCDQVLIDTCVLAPW